MNQLFFAAIAAYIVFLPTVGIARDLSWHDQQRLAQIVLLVMVAATAAWRHTPVRPGMMAVPIWSFMPRGARFALSAALLLGAVSSVLAPMQRWAYVEWSLMTLLIALGFFVADLRRRMGDRLDRLLMGVLLFTATAYMVKFFSAYAAVLVEQLPMHMRWLFDGFSNPRFFGQFQSMTLPLLVLPAMWWAKTPLLRVTLTMIPIFWWMLAFASGTRGTWLAMMCACAMVFLCVRNESYRWLKWQLGTILGGLAAYGLFFFVVPGLFAVHTDMVGRLSDIANLSFRDVLWKSAIEFVASHPILGIGPMHFSYYPNPIAAHPHMSFLQWAAEWGLPSALLMLGLALYAGASYARQLRATTTAGDEAYTLRLALLASLCAAATHSLVDGVIVMPYSQTLLAILCGWALAIYQSQSPSPPRIDRTAEQVSRATIVLSALLLLWGIYPQIPDVVNRAGMFDTTVVVEGVAFFPRFWSSGWIY